ncbi:hypothetical protein [Flammeovirga pacifica]|uniref:DUF4377 domain-containing protein n=1 Tax=Flammeovirga pacifica TaxID=915059 RepID=A0A1S1YZ29_FLAPC|nr:hypothetical protein [Flammeovirga pacifica]OHX66257.1 hypothetical protein NH26_07775 [Flammeovirga pacifica]
MKTTIYTLLFSMVCLYIFSSCNTEESKVTTCDQNGIGEQYQFYRNILTEAVKLSDCETIQDYSEEAITFISENQNCIIIYLVLQEGNNIDDEQTANKIINEMKVDIINIQYSCEIDNLPSSQ